MEVIIEFMIDHPNTVLEEIRLTNIDVPIVQAFIREYDRKIPREFESGDAGKPSNIVYEELTKLAGNGEAEDRVN